MVTTGSAPEMTVLDMRAMSDEDLLAVYRADPDDELTRAAVLRECGRRDRLATEAVAREQVRAEWHRLAYSDYLAAEAECRGELVNRDGVRAGVRDGFALWAGPRRIAERYATQELRDFWLERPRVTVTEFAAQRAACLRREIRLISGQAPGRLCSWSRHEAT